MGDSYTPELLIEVEKLATLQFFVDEIAISLRIDREKFRKAVKAGGNPLADAFERGRITSEAEVRRAVLTQAKQGSTPAQKMILEMVAANTRDLRKIKEQKRK